MDVERYYLDENHTAVGFAARHMVVSTVRGRFKNCRANLAFDTDNLTHSNIDVQIDAASLDTGVTARDNDLRSAQFFDVERYPTISFVSRKIERLYPAHFRVTGGLTIKGATRDVALDVTFGGIAPGPSGSTRIGFLAKASINRRDFGLAWDEVLDSGGLVIGERISITIDAEALSAEAEAAA